MGEAGSISSYLFEDQTLKYQYKFLNTCSRNVNTNTLSGKHG